MTTMPTPDAATIAANLALDAQLRAAGIPVNGVIGAGASASIDYKPEATAAQRTQGASILAAFDWSAAAEAARQVIRNRAEGAAAFLASTAIGQVLRAEVLVLVDEINLLRQWITSFKAAVAASSSLADLKTRTAALANMPDRTAAQAKNAIVSKVQSTSSNA